MAEPQAAMALTNSPAPNVTMHVVTDRQEPLTASALALVTASTPHVVVAHHTKDENEAFVTALDDMVGPIDPREELVAEKLGAGEWKYVAGFSAENAFPEGPVFYKTIIKLAPLNWDGNLLPRIRPDRLFRVPMTAEEKVKSDAQIEEWRKEPTISVRDMWKGMHEAMNNDPKQKAERIVQNYKSACESFAARGRVFPQSADVISAFALLAESDVTSS